MANTSDIIEGTIKTLDNIDSQLTGIIEYVDLFQEYIPELIEGAEAHAQEIVDETMEKVNETISEKLQPIRDKIVDTLSAQVSVVKQKIEEYISPISAFVTIDWSTGTVTPNIPANLGDIVNVLTGIIKMFIPSPAVDFVVKFSTQVMPKVTSVSNHIQQVASYQLEIPDLPEGVTVPPLDIDVEPITIGDIMG